ncbi:Uncharacterised protein [Streptococcus pneumoniae]|nr:Uncharacterised protein [Streptococcus pneumoniae]
MHLLSCRSIHLTVEDDNPTKDRYWVRLISVVPSSLDVISLTNSTWIHVFESHNGWTIFEVTDDTDSSICITDIIK